jgi:hypothetical protein
MSSSATRMKISSEHDRMAEPAQPCTLGQLQRDEAQRASDVSGWESGTQEGASLARPTGSGATLAVPGAQLRR